MNPTLNSLLAGWLMAMPPVHLPPLPPPYTRPHYAAGLSQEGVAGQPVAEIRRFCSAFPADQACQRPGQ